MLKFLGYASLAVLLGVAPGAPSPSGPGADYQDTPVGQELCLSTATTNNSMGLLMAAVCQFGRVQYGLGQGAAMRTKALAQGATCEQYQVTGQNVLRNGPGIWVCFDYRSLLVQRGGTTYGDTFFYSGTKERFDASPNRQGLLNHEAEHTVQWYLFGSRYPQLYFEAGPNGCTNIFEITAGSAAGGYSC